MSYRDRRVLNLKDYQGRVVIFLPEKTIIIGRGYLCGPERDPKVVHQYMLDTPLRHERAWNIWKLHLETFKRQLVGRRPEPPYTVEYKDGTREFVREHGTRGRGEQCE